MKTKEMFKKIETYNKLANEFGKDEMYILFSEDGKYFYRFKTYREFSKFITNHYLEEIEIKDKDWTETKIREYEISGSYYDLILGEIEYNFTIEIRG